MYLCIHECGSLRGQKKMLDLPKLELQGITIVSYPLCVLKSKLRFLEEQRTSLPLNCPYSPL